VQTYGKGLPKGKQFGDRQVPALRLLIRKPLLHLLEKKEFGSSLHTEVL
jgi:hypothetical protein